MATKSDRNLKIVAYCFTIIFSILILFPFVYLISGSLKDDSSIYEVEPRFMPSKAQSVSIVLDYSKFKNISQKDLLDKMLRDSIVALYAIPYTFNTTPIYELKVYGVMDNKSVFYTSVQKAQLRLDLDFGIYQRVNVTKKDALLDSEKYIKASKLHGYKFNLNGLNEKYNSDQLRNNNLDITIGDTLKSKYEINAKYLGSTQSTNNFLMLKNFVYYFKLPVYMYPDNKVIQQYSFFIFIINTSIVIIWAIFIETIMCSLTAYPLSRLFAKKMSTILIMVFMATMMVPFASIMVPQFMMFKSLGFYNNYLALLVPYLYPFPFYIFLYKGFFDLLPGSLFDAARIDGASEIYVYSRICMPLSKPIISLVALQLFLSNWNDFFWAWMVTENQKLWTLNVALFNLSRNEAVKQNFMLGLSLITILPVLVITVLFSDQIKRSLASSGIKG